jgi:NADPH-dependent curcumin reductase CurA
MSTTATVLPVETREIQLSSRPFGRPTPENFRLAASVLPDLQDGQILVRNQFMSVDPYMRGRMNDVKSYSAPFRLDAALDGGAVGEVIASRSDAHKVGDVVVHQLGWRELAVVDAAATTPVPSGLAPTSAFLGALGMTGLTAYAGLLKVAEFKEGDVVFLSPDEIGQLHATLGKLTAALQKSL